MTYLHQRRSLRLPGRDYSRGIYLVTVCALRESPRFGDVVGDQMRRSDVGDIVATCWQWLPTQYPHVTLDEWMVMPDHFHALMILGDGPPPAVHGAPTAVDAKRKPLGQLIGAFKTVSTKRVNRERNKRGTLLWQRDFWDRVVRRSESMEPLRRYIRNNPAALSARNGRPTERVGAAREPPVTQGSIDPGAD